MKFVWFDEPMRLAADVHAPSVLVFQSDPKASPNVRLKHAAFATLENVRTDGGGNWTTFFSHVAEALMTYSFTQYPVVP
jgi:hypothetical protein